MPASHLRWSAIRCLRLYVLLRSLASCKFRVPATTTTTLHQLPENHPFDFGPPVSTANNGNATLLHHLHPAPLPGHIPLRLSNLCLSVLYRVRSDLCLSNHHNLPHPRLCLRPRRDRHRRTFCLRLHKQSSVRFHGLRREQYYPANFTLWRECESTDELRGR